MVDLTVLPKPKNMGGAPLGNSNALKMKPWSDALRLAVLRLCEDGTKRRKLEALAEKVVDMAMEGDMHAVKEIGDRLDGKAVQPIAGEEGGPAQLVVHVYRNEEGQKAGVADSVNIKPGECHG